MQTFLPYSSFIRSARTLDYKRLGKQRVEAKQILNALDPDYNGKGWVTHPATQMWAGYEDALKLYANEMITEWKKRGYNNTMQYYYRVVLHQKSIGGIVLAINTGSLLHTAGNSFNVHYTEDKEGWH